MKKGGRLTKPGAERSGFQPDVIEHYQVETDGKLLEFLFSAMPHRKHTTVKNLLQHRQIAVNGTPTTQFDHPLSPGDKIDVNLSREFIIFRHRRVKLVYEDEDIIVIEKGYGLLSVGTGKANEETAYDIMKEYLKLKDPRNKIFVIHRLDRDTSGLMMFAKNQEAKEIMQHNWNNMVLNRTYVAMVEGTPENEKGTIKSYLKENAAFEVYSTDNPEEGQLAVTRYKILKKKAGYTLLELELDTGRKNQIRVHMKDLGNPIAGDRKYGAKSSPVHRLALHAQTLRFVHPTTRKEMNFVAKLPWRF